MPARTLLWHSSAPHIKRHRTCKVWSKVFSAGHMALAAHASYSETNLTLSGIQAWVCFAYEYHCSLPVKLKINDIHTSKPMVEIRSWFVYKDSLKTRFCCKQRASAGTCHCSSHTWLPELWACLRQSLHVSFWSGDLWLSSHWPPEKCALTSAHFSLRSVH